MNKETTSVQFSQHTRRIVDIISAEEEIPMRGVLVRAVNYYFENVTIAGLKSMIYEYEGRIDKDTGLITALDEGRIQDALEIISKQRPDDMTIHLLDGISERLRQLEIAS